MYHLQLKNQRKYLPLREVVGVVPPDMVMIVDSATHLMTGTNINVSIMGGPDIRKINVGTSMDIPKA